MVMSKNPVEDIIYSIFHGLIKINNDDARTSIFKLLSPKFTIAMMNTQASIITKDDDIGPVYVERIKGLFAFLDSPVTDPI